MMKGVCQKHRHECTEAHVGATVVCRRALVTKEVDVVMSPEKVRASACEGSEDELKVTRS